MIIGTCGSQKTRTYTPLSRSWGSCNTVHLYVCNVTWNLNGGSS